jgi:hypothetical protein
MLASVHGDNPLGPPHVQRTLPAWLRLSLLGLLLLAFGLRLQELTRQDIWWDEARNIDVALRPFWQIASAPELDIQPPVYYWLLHAWSGLFGVTLGQPPHAIAFFSRLLSACAGVAGVALLFPLARGTLPPHRFLPAGDAKGAAAWAAPLRGSLPSDLGGLFGVLLGAFSAFWLAESQEARMYTLGFALAAAAAVVLLRYVAAQDQDPLRSVRADLPRLGAFVLLSTAALLTHYNMVFVLVAWYAWWVAWSLLRRDRWRRIAILAGCGVAMTILSLPMLPIVLRQVPGYENPNIAIVTGGEYLRQNWQAYLGGYAFDLAPAWGSAPIWLWLVLALSVGGLVIAAYAIMRSPETSLARFTFLLAWLFGALALYYVAVLDRNAFNVRYASFVTPALYALIGVALGAYGWWSRLLPAAAALLLLWGLVPSLQADLYDSRIDREHTGEVSAWLKANTGAGDVILVDQKYPFGFYWQPFPLDPTVPNAPRAREHGDDPGAGAANAAETAAARYLFVDINTIDQRLSEWTGDARRVFWLRWFESDTDPRKAVPFLLDKYGRFGGEQLFQGYALQWWDMQPPTDFVLAPNLSEARYAFGPGLETTAVSLPDAPVQAGDELGVVIRWQRSGESVAAGERPLKARVALYDAAGARLVQADERLLNDRHRAPSEWGPGDQPLNVYSLPLPADLPPGTYSLGLLVYDADTLEPLTLLDAAGNPAGQEATLGSVEIEKPS